jgi:hypothetical protein
VFLSSRAKKTQVSLGSRTKHQQFLLFVGLRFSLSVLPSLNIVLTYLNTFLYPKLRKNTHTQLIKGEKGKGRKRKGKKSVTI